MTALTYYLPQIIFGILAAVVLVWLVFFIRELILRSHGKAVCIHCKKAAEKVSPEPYLFLLPVSFGDKYEDAEQYLPSHMRPIASEQMIPSGRRACRLEVYSCGHCGKRYVIITDFLPVRGEEYIKGIYELPYEPFQPLIERWVALRQHQKPSQY
ncbi:MAG: hypothetical protein HFG70_02220 [Hungatella sp.]|nr:hypothetical protein [Hungatella sp.]